MYFLILSLICILLLVLPVRSSMFGKALLLFAALFNNSYAAIISSDAVRREVLDMRVRVDPPMFGVETFTATMLVLLAIAAAFMNSSSAPRISDEIRKIRIPGIVFYVVLLLTVVSQVAVLSTIGPQLIDYEGYNALTDAYGVYNGKPVTRFLDAVLPLSSLILIALAGIAHLSNRKSMALLAFPVILISVVMAVALASRIVGVYFIVAALTFLIGRKRVTGGLLALFGVIGIQYVLEARLHKFQGLNYLGEYARMSMAGGLDATLNVFSNVSAGLKVTSASMTIVDPDHYATIYKLVSFSPLLSSMDGYGKIQWDSMQMIHTYIPVNSFAEAWLFGPQYLIFFWFILFMAMRSVQKSVDMGIVIHLPLITLFMLAVVFSSQYPLRISVRLIYLIIAFPYLVSFIKYMYRSLVRKYPHSTFRGYKALK